MGEVTECGIGCGWYESDLGCTCPPLEKWYQCPLEPEPTILDFANREDIIQAHSLMLNEVKCVKRADKGECDRDCGKCDLVVDTNEVLKAYELAICALSQIIEHWDEKQNDLKERML